MFALGTDSDRHAQLAKRKRYRRGYGGSLIAGMIGLFVASGLGYPLVGIALYWAGVLGMGVVKWLSPVSLFDEREERLDERAAALALNVMTVIGVITIPGAVALEEAGYLTITPLMTGAALAYVGFFAVVAACYGVLWLRQ